MTKYNGMRGPLVSCLAVLCLALLASLPPVSPVYALNALVLLPVETLAVTPTSLVQEHDVSEEPDGILITAEAPAGADDAFVERAVEQPGQRAAAEAPPRAVQHKKPAPARKRRSVAAEPYLRESILTGKEFPALTYAPDAISRQEHSLAIPASMAGSYP